MGTDSLGLGSSQRDLLLVKDNLAAHFREEIISGHLHPGEKIVEVKWAKVLGISQTSVREALNILVSEGFVQKGSGRTAQVTRLSDEDVLHSYELRAVLEGYAARIVAQKQPDLSELDQSLSDMRSAIDCNNLKAFYDRDLQFHVLLAEKTGNKMLVQAIKRIILPLFAFVVMRVQGARTGQQQWIRSLDQHKRIIEALRTRDPVFAERLVTNTVSAFLDETKDVLQSAKAALPSAEAGPRAPVERSR
jgi:DNA-binding GntR family transcriptional regulator